MSILWTLLSLISKVQMPVVESLKLTIKASHDCPLFTICMEEFMDFVLTSEYISCAFANYRNNIREKFTKRLKVLYNNEAGKTGVLIGVPFNVGFVLSCIYKDMGDGGFKMNVIKRLRRTEEDIALQEKIREREIERALKFSKDSL